MRGACRACAASLLCWPPPRRLTPRIACLSRRARAASPPSSMRAAFAWTTAARSALPASSVAAPDRASSRAGAGRHHRRPRGDAAWRRRRPGPLRPPARFCVRGRLANTRCKACCCAAARRWFPADIADKDCAAALVAAEARGAASQTGNLGRSGGHKKRGKSGRYSGRRSGTLRWSRVGFCRFGRPGQ